MKTFQLIHIVMAAILSLSLSGCGSGPREKKIEFVYLALGASDATGVGATPLTEGYVFLIKQELDRRMPGVFLINLGIPGSRIDLIKEQVRVAKQLGTKTNLVTIWTGANDLVHGDDPKTFRQDLRFILQTLREHVSQNIVIGNLPDLTRLPRFQRAPEPRVNLARVNAYNEAIAQEARDVSASVVDLFAQPVREELIFDVDGFHPNDAGHREIARLFLPAILAKLGVK
ncbi:MAG: SGNH/GDSL hydrolase family protein [Nitrospira defluvii]|nr:SGNH/GDSL hydrolase family protein [Nitrospira defluvii]